jgi:hypothetical protein
VFSRFRAWAYLFGERKSKTEPKTNPIQSKKFLTDEKKIDKSEPPPTTQIMKGSS